MNTQYYFTLIKVRNPFDYADKDVRRIKVRKPISTFIKEYFDDDYEVWLTTQIGQLKQVDAEYVPEAGDFIVVTPVIAKGGGKGILGAIAGIALSVVTMGVGSVLSGGAFMGSGALAMSSWTIGATIGAIGVMALGGSLVSHMMAEPVSSDIAEYQQNQTYSWSPQPSQGEGKPEPITFGTFITSGHLLSSHIITDGEKQYLNLLLCGGEGPIDSIDNIKINDNPISNYDSVTVERRLGTNDQTILSNFADTFTNKSLSYKLSKDDWCIDQTNSETCDAIEVGIDLPQGLYYMNNDGNYVNASVVVDIDYRLLPSGGWQKFNNAPFTLNGSASSAIRKIYRQDNLIEGKYEVRVKLNSIPGTTNRYMYNTYWTMLTSVIYDDLIRPNKVLLSIQALATDQLSGGLPNVTWEQTRSCVRVWNSDTQQYENKPASNPAWACYDVIHYCRRLKNIHTGQYEDTAFGVPKEQIDYNQFNEWADFCQNKNLTYNAIINSAASLWDAVRPIAVCGRGRIIQRGTKFGCIFDAPVDIPVALFTVSNIISGSFKEEYIENANRANAIEVSYFDKTKNYQRTTFLVKDSKWDHSDSVDNPTQISLDGCVTYEQAFREAKYRLNVNEYLIRTITFQVDADGAIGTQVGDVILVQHDVPRWGANGTRIKEVDNNTIIMQAPFAFDTSKSYTMIVRFSDDSREERTIVPVGEEVGGIINTDTVQLYLSFTKTPEADDLCVVGSVEPKPFRIIGVKRTGDTRATIEAIEYIKEVYAEADIIPEYNYSDIDTSPSEVQNLKCTEQTYRKHDNSRQSDIVCTWTSPPKKYIDKFGVYLSDDNGYSWKAISTTSNLKTTIDNVKPGTTYKVKITTLRSGVESAGVISDPLTIIGNDQPPAKPTGLACKEVNGGIQISWDPNPEPDIKGYNIYQGINGASLQTSTQLQKYYSGTSTLANITKTGQYVFHIVAVDNANLESEPASIEFTFALPPDVQGFDIVPVGSDLDFRWQAISGCTYEIRRGIDWNVGEYIRSVNTAFLRTLFPIPGEHIFWIKAIDQYGNYSANATQANIELFGDNDRNTIVTIDQVQRGWVGTKINVHVSDSGLQLDNNVWRGEHVVEVNLPKAYLARNWINSGMIGVSDNQITWGDATFQWNSPEANTPWKSDGDITGAKLQHQISTFTGIADNVIESFSLNDVTTGDKNGTTASELHDIEYADGRFHQGALITDTSRLSWNVSIPQIFSTVFYIKIDQPIIDDVVYMTLKSDHARLVVGYDKNKKIFYLQDYLGRRNEVALEYRSNDFIKIGIAQNSTQRKLFVNSFATDTVGSSVQDYGPVGIFTTVFCYPKM